MNIDKLNNYKCIFCKSNIFIDYTFNIDFYRIKILHKCSKLQTDENINYHLEDDGRGIVINQIRATFKNHHILYYPQPNRIHVFNRNEEWYEFGDLLHSSLIVKLPGIIIENINIEELEYYFSDLGGDRLLFE